MGGTRCPGKALSLIGIGVLILMVAACSPAATPVAPDVPTASPAPVSTATLSPPTDTPRSPTDEPPPVATDVWIAVVQRTPYPFTRPLPPADATVIDGTYTKIELKEATPFPCRRCADYRVEGGLWKLQLDRGVFRIYHEITGWRNVGSYAVMGQRVEFFNDPTCQDGVGVYEWALEDGSLTLSVIDDTCAIGVRADNFTSLPWDSCQPPTLEAAISGHWYMPPGC